MISELLTNGIIKSSSGTFLYVLGIVLCIIVPYLIGSVNFPIVISVKKHNGEILSEPFAHREYISLSELYGKKDEIFAIILDALKGAVSALIGFILMPGDGFGYVAGLACAVGDIIPLYFGFKGGKGVAAMLGSLFILNPIVAVLMLVFYFIVGYGTGYKSLGVLIPALLFPFLNYKLFVFFPPLFLKTITSVLYTVVIVLVHIENISNLLKNKEKNTRKNRINK